MAKVIFKHADQAYIYPKLIDSINQLCTDYKKDCTCVAGYRSLECQKATNAGVLATRKGSYQLENGAVYTGTGANRKCWASAYGQSSHCFCCAMDIDDEWFKALTNAQLKKYGLVKSIAWENWHVTLIELVGISDSKKVAIRDSVLKGKGDNDMTVKEFQSITGLIADGIVGAKTIAKAKEVQEVISQILKGVK
jgi:hypothetical protein